MFYVYILQSRKDGSYYIGQTENLEERLSRHNDGRVRSTRAKRPWKLVYFEAFETRGEAVRREMEIKRRKRRRYIESLIRSSIWLERPLGDGKGAGSSLVPKCRTEHFYCRENRY